MGSLPDGLLVNAIIAEAVKSVADHVLEIPPISVLHHDAERLDILHVEGGFIGDDVGHVDGGQQSDFVEGCTLLLLFGIGQEHGLEGVVFLVGLAFDELDPAIAAASEVLDDFEVLESQGFLRFVHRFGGRIIDILLNNSNITIQTSFIITDL